MEVGFRNSRREQNFEAGGVSLSRKPEDQTDTLLLTPGFRNWAIVKQVLLERPLFPTRKKTVKPILSWGDYPEERMGTAILT